MISRGAKSFALEIARTPPITLAGDNARPTRSGDAVYTEPLALCASGLEAARALPATRGTGLGLWSATARERRGGEGPSEKEGRGES